MQCKIYIIDDSIRIGVMLAVYLLDPKLNT